VEFLKKTIKASPYLGVFCVLTEQIFLHPEGLYKKELKGFEKFGVQLIPAKIASSSLIGVFAKGINKKIVTTYLIEENEKKTLEKKGIQIKTIDSTAIGNLIALNEFGGIASPLLSIKQVKELEKFFEIPFKITSIGGSDLTGSSICVTNKGFIVHPNISEKEFNLLEKTFKVKGIPATANYGDRFIANSVIANSKGIAVGTNTSGPEMARIDEGIGRD
jgi:translation initiation factor 6